MLSCGTNNLGRHVPAPKKAQEQETGRIVLFPTRTSLGKGKPRREGLGKVDLSASQVEDLGKYERDGQPDDYARRMIVNVAAFAFIVVLTFSGIWLAEQIAQLRKDQDCAFSGQKNCADLDTQIRHR